MMASKAFDELAVQFFDASSDSGLLLFEIKKRVPSRYWVRFWL
jgi:hypothetical protein